MAVLFSLLDFSTEINFWEIAIVIEWVMVFLEKRTIFFECFMDIPDFKTCKVIKIEFNKQIIDRCDSKIDFHEILEWFIEILFKILYN